ncbi:MAG: DUF6653 family protein [Spirochaetia bacterium]
MAKKKTTRRSGRKKNSRASHKVSIENNRTSRASETLAEVETEAPSHVLVCNTSDQKSKKKTKPLIQTPQEITPLQQEPDSTHPAQADMSDISSELTRVHEGDVAVRHHIFQRLWDRVTGYFFISDDENHWRHHANPWSVWTSLSCLPLLVLAIYSRQWWGIYSWGAVVLAILWLWLNPRIFSVPKTTRCWASYAVFGERIWFHRYDRKDTESPMPRIPAHHFVAIYALSTLMLINAVFLAFALIDLKLTQIVLATVIQVMAHLWFYDRMVWLYTDMYGEDPLYESWVY